jgi:hypothetical protein
MANFSKLLSGRVPVTPYNDLTNGRYEFLNLEQAEPSLGAGAANSILTLSTGNTRVWSDSISLNSVSVSGNINAGHFVGNGYYITDIATADTANYVIQNNQPNITSVGTLTTLSVDGDIAVGNIGSITLKSPAPLNFEAVDSSNVVGFTAPANIPENVTWTLPDRDGNTYGNLLATDATGNLFWSGYASTLLVYTREDGIIEVELLNGFLNILGRSGDIYVRVE